MFGFRLHPERKSYNKYLWIHLLVAWNVTGFPTLSLWPSAQWSQNYLAHCCELSVLLLSGDSTPFLPKSWDDVCKAGRLGHGPCPFPLARCPFPLTFPFPSLSPFLSVLCLGQQDSCFISVILENSDWRSINLYPIHICIVHIYLHAQHFISASFTWFQDFVFMLVECIFYLIRRA